MKFDDEGRIYVLQNDPFDLGVLSLIFAQYHILFQCFHGKKLLITLLLNEINFAETASSDNFDDLEILDGYICRVMEVQVLSVSLSLVRDKGVSGALVQIVHHTFAQLVCAVIQQHVHVVGNAAVLPVGLRISLVLL